MTESLIPGDIPRYELTEWRERYGVVAGVTGRPFDLGLWSDQPVGQVMTRWRRFRDAMGFPECILGHQCHGTDVAWHETHRTDATDEAHGADPTMRPSDHPPRSLTLLDRIDGHVTASAGTLLLVTVADCIPVYLLEPKKRIVALLHSGWRGTAGGILGKGLALLRERAGVEPRDLVMHLGVGICGKCYEVGAEVVEGVGLRADGDGPWHVDLRERLAHQARDAGVRDISTSEWCSAHDSDRFFSHRASRGKDGRMVAYLGRASGQEAGKKRAKSGRAGEQRARSGQEAGEQRAISGLRAGVEASHQAPEHLHRGDSVRFGRCPCVRGLVLELAGQAQEVADLGE